MRQIDTDEMKRIQLEILDVVMKFCDEHGLHCFLDGGTLLGAVRHKGFIPWDDDIDLGMMRADYDKFIKMFNDDNPRYQVHCIENDPEYFMHCAKVYDTNTLYYELDRQTGSQTAVNVEIYVLDNAPDDDKALRKMFLLQDIYFCLHRARYMPAFARPNGNIFRRLAAYAVRMSVHLIPEKIIPKNFFARKMVENSRKYIGAKTKRIGSFTGSHTLATNRENFENSIFLDYEGRKYRAPAGYDEWLTKLYGDYMKPPSEKDKASRHHFEAFIKDENGE